MSKISSSLRKLSREPNTTSNVKEPVQRASTPGVEDIATEYKPARRVRFTLEYVKAHEDPEDGTLVKEA